MAIWQFRLDFIPTSALRANYGVVPVSIPRELAEDFTWWSDVQPPTGFEACVDAILPQQNSWSQEMRIWGDERGDTASVCYDSNRKVEWIGFRVDVREVSLSFVRDICRLAAELECVLLTGAYHLIAPDEMTVLAAINHSNAKQYLEDPVNALRNLKPSEGGIVPLPENAEENAAPPK